MKKRRLAILIPAHNEETVIEDTLISCLKQAKKTDIYVVNDGSTDHTLRICRKLIKNILNIKTNQGKATASNTAITHFKLVSRYDYILPMDADTHLTTKFIEATLGILDKDSHQKIACVVGKVIGRKHNYLTNFRLWEYEVAQSIHKNAQARENAIIVCPGCATVYRSNIYNQIQIPSGTLTEDMDLTFLIHRQNLGRIVFSDQAIVITQDPDNLVDFIKQLDRWYTGFWQCVIKHDIPWKGQTLDAEVAMLGLEGLFNGILSLTLIVLIPLTLFHQPQILVIPFLADLLFFLFPTLLLTIKRHKHWKILRYLPQFYLLRTLSCLVFLKSFFKVILGLDLNMGWNKAARYLPNSK